MTRTLYGKDGTVNVENWNRNFHRRRRAEIIPRAGTLFCYVEAGTKIPDRMTTYLLTWQYLPSHGSHRGGCLIACYGKCALVTLLDSWNRSGHARYRATLPPVKGDS